jgi:hypothetical protein
MYAIEIQGRFEVWELGKFCAEVKEEYLVENEKGNVKEDRLMLK